MEAQLERLLELLLVSKQTEGRSHRTIEWYEERVGRFLNWLTQNGQETVLSNLNLQNARAFISELQNQDVRFAGNPIHRPKPGNLSAHYIHSFVRALKGFASWLTEYLETVNYSLPRLFLGFPTALASPRGLSVTTTASPLFDR